MIRYTVSALADIDQAISYLEERNPTAAERLRRRFQSFLDHLARHPELGRQGRVEGTRERTVSDTHYVIAYRIEGDDVVILAVRHSRRRWPDHFG